MFRAFAILILAALAIGTNQVLAQDQSNPGLVLRDAKSRVIYNYAAESAQGRSGPGGGAEGNQVDMPSVSSHLTKYRASIVVENVGTRQIFAVTWLQSEQVRRKSSTWHKFRIQQMILPGQTAELRRSLLSERTIGDQAVVEKIEFVDGTIWQRRSGSKSQPSGSPLQMATLFVQNHSDPRSRFDFGLGVRADLEKGQVADLRLGGYSLNGDRNWFEVEAGEHSHSQIKDLGERAWSEISEVPIVPASIETFTGKMTFNYKAGGAAHVSPENVLVKAIAGHIYVVHTKTDKIDRYAMFRVETIDDKGMCTMSWKLVPSPKSR